MNKRLLLRLLGYAFCVVPPALATLERFPLWAREGGAPVVSGLALLLLLLAAVPLKRGLSFALQRFLRSPSALGIWFFLWLISLWLSRIADAVAAIALVGVLGSLIGSLFFRLSVKGEVKDEP